LYVKRVCVRVRVCVCARVCARLCLKCVCMACVGGLAMRILCNSPVHCGPCPSAALVSVPPSPPPPSVPTMPPPPVPPMHLVHHACPVNWLEGGEYEPLRHLLEVAAVMGEDSLVPVRKLVLVLRRVLLLLCTRPPLAHSLAALRFRTATAAAAAAAAASTAAAKRGEGAGRGRGRQRPRGSGGTGAPGWCLSTPEAAVEGAVEGAGVDGDGHGDGHGEEWEGAADVDGGVASVACRLGECRAP
jgi:hypothetical protein